METNLTEIQKIRMIIAAELHFDVEKAKEALNFVMGNESIPTPVMQQFWSDGVYYVLEGGHLSTTDDPDSIAGQVIGVAVKMGDRIATVALHDAANGNQISLATDAKCGSKKLFRLNFFDAITDWDGEANTKDYGDALNPEIELKEGQYIPSLAQLHLILLNIREVNKALKAVGGFPMTKTLYWSSTEYNAYYSWYVYFSNGLSNYGSKYLTVVVRPAVSLSV